MDGWIIITGWMMTMMDDRWMDDDHVLVEDDGWIYESKLRDGWTIEEWMMIDG